MPSPAYRAWRRFARNPLSVLGLGLMAAIVVGALLAPWITPYPQHAGAVVDVAQSGKPPSVAHVLGTKGIPNRVDSWGPHWEHDWPLWRAMLPGYLHDLG